MIEIVHFLSCLEHPQGNNKTIDVQFLIFLSFFGLDGKVPCGPKNEKNFEFHYRVFKNEMNNPI